MTSEGRTAGRIVDLLAEVKGGSLCVTQLLIGPFSFVARIGFKRARTQSGGKMPPAVPWEMVTAVGNEVMLRISYEELKGLSASEAEDRPPDSSLSGRR